MSRRRKRFERKPSKYEEQAILITSIVVGIDYQNEEVGERVKNVFYLKSKQYPETGRMCVLWGRSSFNIGDEVMCKGRLNEQGTFLVWSLMITKRAEKSEV